MTSIIKVNNIQNSSGTAAVSIDGSSNVTFPQNATISGNTTVTGNTTITGTTTATGKITSTAGITFGSDTAASNVLDDYEEGTWTPNADGGSTTHHDQFGFYTKVGNLVHAYFNIRINAYNGGSAVRYLFGGLPFSASSTSGKSGAGSIFYFGNIHTSAVALFCRVDPNNSAVYVSGTTGNVASMANINHPWATNNAQIIGFVMYRTD